MREERDEKIEQLEARNRFLQRMVNGLKLHNQELTEERNRYCDELNRIKGMGMFEFASKYCDDKDHEKAGHAFARALGVGVQMTPEDVAIEAAEDNYVPYTAEDFQMSSNPIFLNNADDTVVLFGKTFTADQLKQALIDQVFLKGRLSQLVGDAE